MDFNPLIKYFLQLSIIEFAFEGTPGSEKHFYNETRSSLEGL